MTLPSWLYAIDRDWSYDFELDLLVIEAAPRRNPWAWVWAAWFGLFAVFETIALLTRKNGATLTANLRRWLALTADARDTDRYWRVKRLAFLAFLSWLAGHFILKAGGYL